MKLSKIKTQCRQCFWHDMSTHKLVFAPLHIDCRDCNWYKFSPSNDEIKEITGKDYAVREGNITPYPVA